MKIRKIGMLEGNRFQLVPDAGEFAVLLTNYEVTEDMVSTILPLIIGQGPSARLIDIEIPISRRNLEAQLDAPTNLAPDGAVKEWENKYIVSFMFKNQVFVVSDVFPTNTYLEEAALLIRKYDYEEQNKLKRLRLQVEAIERVSSQIGIYKRTSIPEVVKLAVWERDEGECVRCGSTHNLHFDHIIPVDKGGSSSEMNIQLLCADCNLEKSDKIAF